MDRGETCINDPIRLTKNNRLFLEALNRYLLKSGAGLSGTYIDPRPEISLSTPRYWHWPALGGPCWRCLTLIMFTFMSR